MLPATATIERRSARSAPGRRVLLQRPGRPGQRRRTRSTCCGRCWTRGSRSSASASATSCSAARSASAPTSSGTATAASTSRCMDRTHRQGRGHRAQPRLRRRRPARREVRRPATAVGTAYGRVRVSHVCLNDDVVEGLRVPRPAGLLGAVPPRGGGRPARRRLPVRPVRRPDGRLTPRTTAGSRRLMPQPHRHHSASWSSAPGRSSSARPASSTTPAPRPAGCCARRASGSSWSTPTRRRS